MIEVFSLFLNRSCGAGCNAGVTIPAVLRRWRIDSEGKVCKDGQKANPCAVAPADKKVIPADPTDPGCLCNVLMGEMPSLLFPVDELGGRYWHSPVSEVLNGMGQDEPHGIEKNIHSLVVLKVERSRPVFDVIQDGIR